MLIRRHIDLVNGKDDLAPVISRHQLAVQVQARTIIQEAHQRAEKIISAAEQEAEASSLLVRQRAEEAFWERADTMFMHWQKQQQQWESDVLSVMDVVLEQALEQLLTEVPESQRLQGLLRQLLLEKTQTDKATLCCHPSQQASIATMLENYSHLNWQLQPEESLPPDSLKLVTPQGELYLDWQLASQQLKPCPVEQQAP
ncbi:type III secretion system stator protein SctL [Pantoea sp. PNA 03-3]|uniref:type III secretion system stator protein SctL n=1 Tax=Pantoea sp. PNA 03-3 TaxID=2135460 RepID=UPI000D7542AD|nr:type III secretion system stator protein SctL [Pantoea sp. PNA 03-3]PXV73950.1 type III secretion protein L [Pantoea sp. PNA 03-3]